MKNLIGLAVIAAVLVSSQSFAALRVTVLNCGGAKTADGHYLLGVGYKVQIRDGFDTHARNPDGTIGAPVGPFFQLISTVISPSAQPRAEDLNLVSRDADGNFILAGQNKTVTVNKNFTQAVIQFSNATATCD